MTLSVREPKAKRITKNRKVIESSTQTTCICRSDIPKWKMMIENKCRKTNVVKRSRTNQNKWLNKASFCHRPTVCKSVRQAAWPSWFRLSQVKSSSMSEVVSQNETMNTRVQNIAHINIATWNQKYTKTNQTLHTGTNKRWGQKRGKGKKRGRGGTMSECQIGKNSRCFRDVHLGAWVGGIGRSGDIRVDYVSATQSHDLIRNKR